MSELLRKDLKFYCQYLVLPILILSLIIVLIDHSTPGNIENATIDLGESEIYTQKERADAAEIVLKSFSGLNDCTLETVVYSERSTLYETQYNLEHYSAEYPEMQTIIFLCDFIPSERAGGQGFTPNTTYRWEWILVRDTPASPGGFWVGEKAK